MLVLVLISILIVWSSLSKNDEHNNKGTNSSVTELSAPESSDVVSSTSVTSTVSTTSSALTTTMTTETTATTNEDDTPETTDDASDAESSNQTTAGSNNSGTGYTAATTAKPQEQLSPYINAGYSPNSDFYQQHLSIAGDSIAYGFNAYGFIPYEHNYAQESVSMWNLNGFTFCGGCGLVEAIGYNQPSLLYMSIGMNDVNMNSPEIYANQYASVISDIRSCSPDTVIVVAGISPVGAESMYTTNDIIRSYNSALQSAVEGMKSDHVYYFDAYSVLCDEYLNLRYDCSGGDGIHLQTHCYEDLLTALFNFLDTTKVKNMLS